mmetsp:Transcript_27803/g.64547  ORF Transcript_27803/g.64547 Transcript_27803/m.64547 type:complete len:369 (-) Transcript_27803:147-1253(-)
MPLCNCRFGRLVLWLGLWASSIEAAVLTASSLPDHHNCGATEWSRSDSTTTTTTATASARRRFPRFGRRYSSSSLSSTTTKTTAAATVELGLPRGGGASGNGLGRAEGGGSRSSNWSQYPRKVKRKVAFTRNGARSTTTTTSHHHYRSSSALGSSSSSSSGSSNTNNNDNGNSPNPLASLSHWWNHNVRGGLFQNLPKIQCRVEPTTTLKLRKTFRPLGTIVQLGADYGMQTGVWQFKSSWEDALIGGKLTLAGRELQFRKTWQLTAVQDLVTRLRLRAAVDLQTYKAYCRVGFRTERLAPLNVVDGFTLRQQFSLDGGQPGHIKVEVKSNFCLPEPEIEYSTETQRSLVGMGDVEINIEELNLLLDY